jgi:hypothetical protein
LAIGSTCHLGEKPKIISSKGRLTEWQVEETTLHYQIYFKALFYRSLDDSASSWNKLTCLSEFVDLFLLGKLASF